MLLLLLYSELILFWKTLHSGLQARTHFYISYDNKLPRTLIFHCTTLSQSYCTFKVIFGQLSGDQNRSRFQVRHSKKSQQQGGHVAIQHGLPVYLQRVSQVHSHIVKFKAAFTSYQKAKPVHSLRFALLPHTLLRWMLSSTCRYCIDGLEGEVYRWMCWTLAKLFTKLHHWCWRGLFWSGRLYLKYCTVLPSSLTEPTILDPQTH